MMTIGPGSRVGPYEVVGPLGAGGMGEVWRARDPRLNREVAIKVLPASLAGDPERRARFERECRLLASLNHPNIASVLGLEDAEGHPALVMELVEGPTLEQRLVQEGALEVPAALELARQIAEALEYAHERGIVHRDLKPGNVKLTPDGAVKVLDFGLAKALAPDDGTASSPQLTQSPTMSVGTQTGVLLGTAAYMAPEQARGKPVDRRADIWSFGVVLFEMLTGRQLFAGETVSDTIARILERQPDWSSLPARTPARVRELLRRCLDKDARQRLRDVGDARLELEASIRAIAAGERDPSPAARRDGLKAIAALAAVALAGVAIGFAVRSVLARRPVDVLRLSVFPPTDATLRNVMFSNEDGGLLASCSPLDATVPGERAIYRRPIDRFEWTKLPGTEGMRGWDQSHDGRWVYFIKAIATGSRQRQLMRVPLDGSAPPAVVVPWGDDYFAWDVLPDGRIVVVSTSKKRFAILTPGDGKGAVWKTITCDEPVVELTVNESLPDGKACLCVASYFAPGGWTMNAAVLDLNSGRVEILEPNSSDPEVTASGHLLMTRGRSVLAAPWDSKRHRITAQPVPVLQGVRVGQSWSHANVAVSRNGTFGYEPGGIVSQNRSVAILRPDGAVELWNDEHRPFERPPAISPDGRRVAVTSTPPGVASYEIVLLDRGRPGARRLSSFEGEDSAFPVFSSDGRSIVWMRQGVDSLSGVYAQPVDGSVPARRVFAARSVYEFDEPMGAFPDGRSFLMQSHAPNTPVRLRRLTIVGDSAIVTDVVKQAYDVTDGSVAPDGRRIAYLSYESDEPQVVVAMLGADGRAGDAIAVSGPGGDHPRWADGGATLLWTMRNFDLMAAHVSPSLDISSPERRRNLEALIIETEDFVPFPDGGLVFVRKAEGEDEIRRFNVVLNFEVELARILKASRTSR